MDVLHVSIEIGGAPPDFVVVTLADSTGAVHHRQRFGEVRLGRQTLEVELVDARGKRPPPGLYLLAIVPHGRDGLPSGGDEWEVRLDSESA